MLSTEVLNSHRLMDSLALLYEIWSFSTLKMINLRLQGSQELTPGQHFLDFVLYWNYWEDILVLLTQRLSNRCQMVRLGCGGPDSVSHGTVHLPARPQGTVSPGPHCPHHPHCA